MNVNTKIAPDQAFLRQSSTMNSEIIDDSDPVPIYGELETTIQTHSPEGTRIEEGFEGTNVDLKKSPYVVKNDLFDGLLHVMIRDLPGNTYDFDGDKDVLWEVQMQGKFKRQIKGPIYYAVELPQHEKYKVTAFIRLVVKGALNLARTRGHKEMHLSYGGGDELPHMAGPAFHSFDRVVVTPEGETPPPLGNHLPQMESDINRKKAFSKTGLELDLNSIYTFSAKSRRFDPIKWRVVGVPIVRSFNVARLTESFRLALYEVVEESGIPVEDPKGNLTTIASKKHTMRNTFLWLQMSRKQQHEHEAVETSSPKRRWNSRRKSKNAASSPK